MKRLKFRKLQLLSLKDKKAREIVFHPRMTIIKGENEVGKSALLKSIYRALGAETPMVTKTWESSNVFTALHFTIEERDYIILRYFSNYSLFDGNGNFVKSFSSVTNELSPHLSNLFSYKLQLPLRSNDSEVQATPAFLYLPFYLDQDKSWTNAWASFDKLAQFKFKKQDIVFYHTGVRPNKYYELKNKLSEKEFEIGPLNNKIAALNSILKNLEAKISKVIYDIDLDAYKSEIEKLLIAYNQIKNEEDNLKEKLAQAYHKECIIHSQIFLTDKAISEISADYNFMLNTPDLLSCPTCGAEYENDFSEQFSIAQDEDRCIEMLSDLKLALNETRAEIDQIKFEYSVKHEKKCEIEGILNDKQGELTLKEIIEIEGKKELRAILGKDIRDCEKQLTYLIGEVERIRDEIKSLEDRRLKAEIKKYYCNIMNKNLMSLNVLNLHENEQCKMTGNFNISGSDTPRALLAYYYSILSTIDKYSTSTFCPIVVDSPNQQDQDGPNRSAIMNFIKDNIFEGWQVIVGTVDTFNVGFDGEIIELNDKYELLQKGPIYQKVAEDLKPLIELNFRGMLD